MRELSERESGVAVTPETVGRLLRRRGLSPERHLVGADPQDREPLAGGKQVEYLEIRERARQLGAQIFVAKEAGVRNDSRSGTTWEEV